MQSTDITGVDVLTDVVNDVTPEIINVADINSSHLHLIKQRGLH
jgi:hypothetical protein